MVWVIGASGLCGVGKTLATRYFEKIWGFERVYFGQAVLDEVASRGLPPTPENEKKVRLAMRAELGPAFLVIRSAEDIKKIADSGRNITIDAIYTMDEYDHLCLLLPGTPIALLAIRASFQTRCARLVARPERPLQIADIRSRDETEKKELDIQRVMTGAAKRIINNGTLEEFKKKLDIFWRETKNPRR